LLLFHTSPSAILSFLKLSAFPCLLPLSLSVGTFFRLGLAGFHIFFFLSCPLPRSSDLVTFISPGEKVLSQRSIFVAVLLFLFWAKDDVLHFHWRLRVLFSSVFFSVSSPVARYGYRSDFFFSLFISFRVGKCIRERLNDYVFYPILAKGGLSLECFLLATPPHRMKNPIHSRRFSGGFLCAPFPFFPFPPQPVPSRFVR